MKSSIGYDQSRCITKNFILYFCARNLSLQWNPTTGFSSRRFKVAFISKEASRVKPVNHF